MDLVKKNIHMNRQKNKAVTQVTLDDDYNLPDNKEDIEKIIKTKGNIKIDEMTTADNQAVIKGNMEFEILYIGEIQDRLVYCLNGKIPFEETIYLDEVETGDNVCLSWELEDLTVGIINSRKLSVQTIVTLTAVVEELHDEETGVALLGAEAAESLNRTLDMLQIAIHKKDIYRVKDEIVLQSGQSNIVSLLWKECCLNQMEFKVLDNKISVKGNAQVFFLYLGEGEDNRIQWIDTEIPFSGTLECFGCNEGMVEDIHFTVKSADFDVKPDYDGEERIISADIVLELDIKIFEEEPVELLADVYATNKEIIPVKKTAGFESLVMKNFAKCRTNERMKLKSDQPRILQLCHSTAAVKIDEITVAEAGIEILGAVDVQILYVTTEDRTPFFTMKGLLPFKQMIEIPGMDESCTYQIQTEVEQLSASMIDSEEIEVKTVINLKTFVVRKMEEEIITEVEEHPLDSEKINQLPGFVGYNVKKGDTLWSIGKQYYISTEDIRELNDLQGDELVPGKWLVLVKKVENMGG